MAVMVVVWVVAAATKLRSPKHPVRKGGVFCYTNRVILRVSQSWTIEFGPLLVFFLCFEIWGFLAATSALVVSTFFALLVAFITERRVPLFPLISGLCVFLFGLLTLYFQDPRFLVLEYTLYNGFFGMALLIGLLFNVPLLRYMFGTLFALKEYGWMVLSYRWAVFFLLVAFANELVWRYTPEHLWVIFRIGVVPAFLCFGLYQFTLSRRERLPEASAWGLIR